MSEEEKKKQKERLEKYLVEVEEFIDDTDFMKQMETKSSKKRKMKPDDEEDD